MRKSLHDIQQIESYIFGRMSIQENQDFKVRLLVNAQLYEEVEAQKEAYALVKTYGRKKLKAELNAIHEKLFTHPEKRSFRQLIKSFFNTKK